MNRARITAQILLDTEAVLLNPDNPFTLTSGRKSPVYVDCRKLIAFPNARRQLIKMAIELLHERVGYDQLDVIAGGETAGIPFATLIGEQLHLPICYIRKKPKGFGRNARIEGNLQAGAKTLLVEDMTTDGGSKLSFIDGLREAGAICNHCLVMFEYGIFPEKMKALKEVDLNLHALANWWDVLAFAKENNALGSNQLSRIEAFLNHPDEWS